MLLLAIDSATRLSVSRKLNTSGAAAKPVLAVDAGSPTGYELGQRQLLLSDAGLDGYQWIMQTQQMLVDDGWRIRHVDYDNFPEGRPVHWSSPFRWWLAGVGWLRHVVVNEPWPIAIERVAPWANTVLLLPLLLGLTTRVARHWNGIAAGVLALALIGVFPVFEPLAVGTTDHHGIAIGCGLLSVLMLALGGGGWIRDPQNTAAPTWPERRAARRWFVAGAVAGAAGLWISAPTQAPLLVAIGASALLGTGWLGRDAARIPGMRPDPSLWRAWGVAGALSSMLFYALEYLPGPFQLRLEVNHPVYALAWLGAGDLLCRATRWLARGRFVATRCGAWGAWLAGCAVLVVPVLLVAAGAETFLVSDPFLWALHADYIVEFSTLARRLGGMSIGDFLVAIGLVPLIGVPLALLSRHRDVAPPWKGLAVLVLIPGVVTLALGFWQVRWLGVSAAVWVAGLTVGTFLTTTPGSGFRWTGLRRLAAVALLLAILAPHSWHIVKTGWAAARDRVAESERDVRRSVARDVAHWLRARMGSDPGVVLSGPGTTSAFIYHGGFKGLGTLYWENRAGLKAAAEILGARATEEAQALIAKRGVTHIVLLSWDGFADAYVRLAHGLRAGQSPPADAFAFKLQRGSAPPRWLRAIAYRLPDHPALRGHSVRVFEVVPEQQPADALVRHAQFLFSTGEAERAAAQVQAALALEPRHAPALITFAQLQLARGQPTEAARTFAQLQASLGGATSLAIEDLIGLALLCDAFGETAQARHVFSGVLAQLDARGLRRLAPDVLLRFLLVAQQLQLAAARPELVQLGIELLPNDALRESLRRGATPR